MTSRPHYRVASLGHIDSARLMQIALNLTDFVRAGRVPRFDELEHIQSTDLCELDSARHRSLMDYAYRLSSHFRIFETESS